MIEEKVVLSKHAFDVLNEVLRRCPMSLIRYCAEKFYLTEKEWAKFQVIFGLVGRIDPENKAKWFGIDTFSPQASQKESLTLPFKK